MALLYGQIWPCVKNTLEVIEIRLYATHKLELSEFQDEVYTHINDFDGRVSS